LSRDFHVTAGANIVLQRHNRRVALTREKTVEPIEQIFVNFARELVALFF